MTGLLTVLVVPIVLTLVAAVVTYRGDLRTRRESLALAQRQLASALAAEIGAVRSRVRRRHALLRIAQSRLGTDQEVLHIPRKWDTDLCPVFSANASKVGELPEPLPAVIVGFYSSVLSLSDEFGFIGGDGWDALDDATQNGILGRVSKELGVCMRKADFAVNAVSLLHPELRPPVRTAESQGAGTTVEERRRSMGAAHPPQCV